VPRHGCHLISGGRFDLALGAGWYQPEYDAAGIAFGSAGQRLGRLDASLGMIRQLLAGTPVHHADASYRIDGLDLDVLPRSGQISTLGGSGSACRTSSSGRTACPRWPRSSAACKPASG
jgi:alkanesulfonate monooxygenase SsuD/methylene tetrahydromethanopterin reductase-like flavin-dependent oxidoreductase (luciferase family)